MIWRIKPSSSDFLDIVDSKEIHFLNSSNSLGDTGIACLCKTVPSMTERNVELIRPVSIAISHAVVSCAEIP